jgi:hypothetical protein
VNKYKWKSFKRKEGDAPLNRINEDGDEVPRPEFWLTVDADEFEEILYDQDGWLNEEQCERLWRVENRPGEPPKRLHVAVRRESRH